MSTSAGKTKFVLNASAPEFQPANPERRCLLNASAPEFQLAYPGRRCLLNASAPEFQPANSGRRFNASAPEFKPGNLDQRCLFLTFSNGFPLTERQIFAFFTRRYGSVVEHAFVHRPRHIGRVAKPPLFGKVMFKNSIIPDYVMGTKEKVCLVVDGTPMYCKRFVSPRS